MYMFLQLLSVAARQAVSVMLVALLEAQEVALELWRQLAIRTSLH